MSQVPHNYSQDGLFGTESEEHETNMEASSLGPGMTPFRPQDELPASPMETISMIPGATPPSTYTEPLIGSSATAAGAGMVGNTLLSSQVETFPRRARGRSELGLSNTDPAMSESDAGIASEMLMRPAPGAVGGRQQDLDELSMAMSHPRHRPGTEDERTTSRLFGGTVTHQAAEQRVRVIWGTNIIIADAMASFKAFLTGFTMAHRKIFEARSQGPDAPLPVTTAQDLDPLYPRLLQQIRDTEIYNLNIDCANLRAFPATSLFAQQLLHYPMEIVQMMDMVVNEFFFELYPEVDLSNDPIQVRPFNTGKIVNMRDLDPSDLDKLITIKGLIIRVSNIIPDMRVAYFVCSACNHSVTVESVRGNISEPSRCPREDCGALHSMTIVHNRCLFSDKQLIKIQETPGTSRAPFYLLFPHRCHSRWSNTSLRDVMRLRCISRCCPTR